MLYTIFFILKITGAIIAILVGIIFFIVAAIGIYSYYAGSIVVFYICAAISLGETIYNIFINHANPGTLYMAVMVGLGATLYHMFANGASILIAFSNTGIILLFINAIIYLLSTLMCIINLFARRYR